MQELMDQLGLELVYHQQLQLTGHQLYGSSRLRPRRTDHTNQGAMTSYIDRIILKETRDTLY
jgi:hypothetical protein